MAEPTNVLFEAQKPGAEEWEDEDCSPDDPDATVWMTTVPVPGKPYREIIHQSENRGEAMEFFWRAKTAFAKTADARNWM